MACRICLDSDPESGPLETLSCHCKGDLSLAHQQCAYRWFTVTRKSGVCELCRGTAWNFVIPSQESLVPEVTPADAASRVFAVGVTVANNVQMLAILLISVYGYTDKYNCRLIGYPIPLIATLVFLEQRVLSRLETPFAKRFLRTPRSLYYSLAVYSTVGQLVAQLQYYNVIDLRFLSSPTP